MKWKWSLSSIEALALTFAAVHASVAKTSIQYKTPRAVGWHQGWRQRKGHKAFVSNGDGADNELLGEMIPFKAAIVRCREALPGKRDAIDRDILDIMLPAITNLAMIPVVGAVDTFWVGRMGDALALAGQSAANQCYFSIYFLISFLPTIIAPLVAKAAGSGDIKSGRKVVSDALFVSNFLGVMGTLLLFFKSSIVLSLALPPGAPATKYATEYLRLRSLSLIPSLASSIGSAAFRGCLDTVTPLKISIVANLINLILDPVAIFSAKMGVAGAALATAASEIVGGMLYVLLLLRRQLLQLSSLLKPPRFSDLLPLLKGSSVIFFRQVVLNVAFMTATRMTQGMDRTGVSAAVYAITNQVYNLGLVVMLAVQQIGAALVPASRLKYSSLGAQRVADRIIGWSTLIAVSIALLQVLCIPYVTPLFSPLQEVRDAVAAPAFASAVVMLSNGPLFSGEGIMMGVEAWGFLTGLTSIGCVVMVTGLMVSSKLGLGVTSVWLSLFGFHIVQSFGTMYHHFKLGPLAAAQRDNKTVELMDAPLVGEVCLTDTADIDGEDDDTQAAR